jgi:ketosteroid isomerase-like protein
MKRLLVLASLLLAPALGAQATGASAPAAPAAGERAAVLAVVKALFDGMRKGDSAAVRAVFHPDVQLTTMLVGRDGTPRVEVDSLVQFLRAVGTPHDVTWDERTHDEEVRIDGTLAQAWTPYEFWAGDKFSHCGVDAFTLAKTTAGWRIVALADTRRRTGCRGNATAPAKP